MKFGPAVTILVLLLAATLTGTGAAFAQQVTGTLGSPSATTTISGQQLPPPNAKFGGVIKDDALRSKPGGRRPSCRRRARRTCC